ncbi:uncharacterized protein CPUR_01594 [Claviceps purpurea 20.1]|uniref:Uncharacterized protein n=1 Tax=Claviceps purpurea (strain 20.1) TaxID=1111077 RepID=M1WB86_CLAP2|nr:uncharacterized protein CPUR_01594 [Claviceps purpurea 20.1]
MSPLQGNTSSLSKRVSTYSSAAAAAAAAMVKNMDGRG